MTPTVHSAAHRTTTARRIGAVAALALGLAGCVAPQDAGRVHALHDAMATAQDQDRTRAARVAAGIVATELGVSLGCTMLLDGPPMPVLRGLADYCVARATPVAEVAVDVAR